MEIFQIAGLALTATMIIVLVRQSRGNEAALLISLVVGATIFLLLLDRIGTVIQVLADLSQRAGINQFYLNTILKIIGIAYVAEFGSQVCRDAGENAIASKVELAAKVLIMVLAIPIIVAILESIIRLLP
ncbi:stage III sporulation protein AD [Neomoorella thermoacetica]|uniref:Stage III sporulation protein AC/AD protein family protein n=3 Tax=Neomoorella thermoacetica TaxID=1525 RepID=A0A1D7XBG2_NEOTH|nr:stage III sporulation protein AD [Moorella thermoacetica]MDN5326857.1 stage sporulation protein [Moorella sp. (in: firmicutes)]AKX94318.1 stage III sporulation protein AC/AD protein family protein [Moorella thermoacetica]AKX96956.1 stage III sporulation protein AC/AD protein family protein [Moorella thermoacetica]AOQ24266.1 Stage III sporulation protein AC/AD protein family protein [Moorella thermoacetica]APC08742.1 stage III sporulation protein AC/AD protein family protein [Moorella thermo